MLRMKKTLTLGTLYFVQGLPYGLQDKFIPAYLRSSGLSYTRLSLMKLLLLPWICKAAFAPIIDSIWTKWLWLLLSLYALAVVAFAGLFIIPEDITSMSVWLFILNLFCATQDVAADGIALQILNKEEMGLGNAAQVIGYKLGALFGGGILVWIHLQFQWYGLCVSLASLYLGSSLIFIALHRSVEKTNKFESNSDSSTNPELSSMQNLPQISCKSTEHSKLNDSVIVKRNIGSKAKSVPEIGDMSKNQNEDSDAKSLMHIFRSIFTTKGTWSIAGFVLVYKLGERGALSTFPLFLIDQGISKEKIGLWNGFIGQLLSLTGSAIGGWLISDQRKLNYFLHHMCIIRCIPISLQCILVSMWKPGMSQIWKDLLFYSSLLSLCSLEFAAGMITTAVFTQMMICSQRAPQSFQASHYTILSSVEIMGKLVFAAFAGALIDWFGISLVYLILVVLAAFTVLIIPDIN